MSGIPSQAPPFRFVERGTRHESPRRSVATMHFTANDPLARGAAAVPASLLFEALCQAAAFLSGEADSGKGRIVRIDQAEILDEVRPGETLTIASTLIEESAMGLRAESVGEVEGRVVARLQVLIGR